MAITAQPLAGRFGVSVAGTDIASASDADLRELLALLLEHRFIVVPGQTLDNDGYVAFGRRWGEPVILISSDNRLDTHPEMIRQGNGAKVPEFFRNVANHWHCDSSYEETVASFTMLYGIETPDNGGITLFADLVAAHDALPEAERERLAALRVRHSVSAARALPDETIADLGQMPEELRRNARPMPDVVQPMIARHPVSSRKALYGLGGSCCGIEGMEDEVANELLLDLRRYATQERFVSEYRLQPGDILIWDNFSVMHRATPIEYTDEPGKRRLNYRISVKGVPSFADELAEAAQ